MVHEAIGIRHGQITTIHDPTNTNVVVDAPHKDLRRARSAMLSLSPTTTGSATAIALIYPELKGKLNGHAVRAPVLNATLTDCVFEMERPVTDDRGQRAVPERRRGPACRHPRLRDAAAGLRRLCQRHAQRDRRRTQHDGHRRDAAQGLRLVRQRGRLCLPHGRSRQHRHRAEVLMSGVRNYAIVTASYWSFTLTDGALRMLVLLHFYALGYTPFMLALLFLLYEAAGIFANLGGGWLAARFGIPRMLATGLMLADRRARDAVRRSIRPGARRCRSPGSLRRRASPASPRTSPRPPRNPRSRRRREGGRRATVPLGRLVHRLEERDEGRRLLRRRPAARVRRIPRALWLMAAMLAVVLVGVPLSLPRTLGKAKASKIFRELFAKTRASICSRRPASSCSARATCGSSSACRCFSTRMAGSYMEVAGFLARLDDRLWRGAGARAQRSFARSPDGLSREVPEARLWGAVLTAIPVALALLVMQPSAGRASIWWWSSASASSALPSPSSRRCTPI